MLFVSIVVSMEINRRHSFRSGPHRLYFLFHTLRFPFHIIVAYCVTQLKYEDVLTSCELWSKSRNMVHELRAAER